MKRGTGSGRSPGYHRGVGDVAHVSAAALLANLTAHAFEDTGERSLRGPFRGQLTAHGGFTAALTAMRLRLRGAPGTMEDDAEEGGAATVVQRRGTRAAVVVVMVATNRGCAGPGPGGGADDDDEEGGIIRFPIAPADMDALAAVFAHPGARPEVLQYLVPAVWLLARDPRTKAMMLASLSTTRGTCGVDHGKEENLIGGDDTGCVIPTLVETLATWLPSAAASSSSPPPSSPPPPHPSPSCDTQSPRCGCSFDDAPAAPRCRRRRECRHGPQGERR